MRYIVVGTSGAGKSTFARALAEREGCRYVELDDLYWAADWKAKPRADFEALVHEAAAGERWVADGNYSAVRPVLWPRGTHIVWLNYGRSTVMAQIFRRTLARVWSRQALWHGNRESLRRAFFSRESILVWSATTYGKNRLKYAQLRSENAFPHLTWLEFRSPAQARRFLARRSD